MARQRRPHALGAAGVPAAVGRSRPLAHQPGRAAVRGADGAGGALPALPGAQVRRVRAARGRIADRLRQPEPTTAPSSTACRRRSATGSSIWRSGSTPGTGSPGARPTGSPRKCCSSSSWSRSFCLSSMPSSKDHAFPSPRSWEFASNIVKHRNGLDAEVERALVPGHGGRGRGGRVHRVPEGLARAAAPEGRPRRPRATPTSRRTPAR